MNSRPARREPTRVEVYYQNIAILFQEMLLRLAPAILLVVVLRLLSGPLDRLGVAATDFLLALLITTLTANAVTNEPASREDRR
jgi:hypothetical protein